MNSSVESSRAGTKTGYNRFLLLVAGLGGLLYGVDVGIIAGALPYLEATSGLTADKLSYVVAAVLLGGVISTLFAGALADFLGRKPMMVISGVMFVVSVPAIALAQGYDALIIGRLLQGVSGGLIGVVVPLYLAECLDARDRGKGTGVFQWLLTLGFVVAAVIAIYFSARVDEAAKLHDAAKLFAVQDHAWRGIFWFSLPPGVLFVIGSLMVAESPRWLFRKGKKDAALRALLRSRTEEQAAVEQEEMERVAAEESGAAGTQQRYESLLQRKYVLPFVLACIILACNQATGINSVILYNTDILIQAGLSDQQAHSGYLIFTILNFLMTIIGVLLVDRRGRKFLLSLGTAGVILSMLATAFVFHKTEERRVDVKDAVQASVIASNQTVVIDLNTATTAKLLGPSAGTDAAQTNSLVVIYSYGDFNAATKVVRTDDVDPRLVIDRKSCVPDTKVAAFFKNPFANYEAAKTAPLKIQNALITPVPSTGNGWLTALCLYCFISFYAAGPGVCVWLALSELMPTRIRSNGMSIALLFNIAVSTVIAGIFLPAVGKYGYTTMFLAFGGCTVVYFITAAFFLPETKGKTLEEIEAVFAKQK